MCEVDVNRECGNTRGLASRRAARHERPFAERGRASGGYQELFDEKDARRYLVYETEIGFQKAASLAEFCSKQVRTSLLDLENSGKGGVPVGGGRGEASLSSNSVARPLFLHGC